MKKSISYLELGIAGALTSVLFLGALSVKPQPVFIDENSKPLDVAFIREMTTEEQPSVDKGIGTDGAKLVCEAVVIEPEPQELLAEEPQTEAYNYEIELLKRCVMAEAGGEDELGKRLVIDVILNRVDRGEGTITEVIYAKDQFEVVAIGTIDSVVPTDDIEGLIYEELANRYNSEVLYFRTNHYHTFGTPLFQHGGHYFSK